MYMYIDTVAYANVVFFQNTSFQRTRYINECEITAKIVC